MARGIITAVGTLAIVILILYLAFVVTKYIGTGAGLKSRSKCMQVKDQIMLGRDRTAAVVQIGTRFFLLGITGNQISLISELEEGDLIPVQDTGQEPRPYPDFKELMDKIGRGKNKDG